MSTISARAFNEKKLAGAGLRQYFDFIGNAPKIQALGSILFLDACKASSVTAVTSGCDEVCLRRPSAICQGQRITLRVYSLIWE